MSEPVGDDPWGGPPRSGLDKDFAELILRTVDTGRELVNTELAALEHGAEGQDARLRELWKLHKKVVSMIESESNRRFKKRQERKQGGQEPWEAPEPLDDDDDV